MEFKAIQVYNESNITKIICAKMCDYVFFAKQKKFKSKIILNLQNQQRNNVKNVSCC